MIVDAAVLLAVVPAALALTVTPGADRLFFLAPGLRVGPMVYVAGAQG